MPKATRDARRAHRLPPDQRNKPPATLDEAAKAIDLHEAARITSYSIATLRDAIKTGELDAFIPGGRSLGHTGPRHGYRVTLAELDRWYFGKPRVEP